jgi:signal transduction histidine kinase
MDKENLITTKKRDKPYTSIQRKIWLSFAFIYTPVFLIVYFLYYSYAFQVSLNILTSDLSRTVEGIAASIDAENFKLLYQEESVNNPNCPPKEDSLINGYYPEDNPRFQAHMAWLQTILYYHHPDAYVYTYVKGPKPGDVIGIGSIGYFRNPKEGFKFCELYNSNGETQIYEGLSQRTDVWNIYKDSYGSWITSYMPIKDTNGEIVGAVGVDIPADVVVKLRWDLQVVAMLSFSILYLIILVIILRLTATVTKPIQNLALITSQIGESEPQMKFSEIKRQGIHSDEVDVLIESMQSMVERIEKQKLELTQSREQMQDLTHTTLRAQEAERRFVSRELHDQAGHLLINLRYTIESIAADLQPDSPPQALTPSEYDSARARISTALKQIDKTLEMIRSLSHQIRTSLLDVGDVNLALQESCLDFKRDKNIEITYDGTPLTDLSEEIAVSLYRFLQEALTNVLKHASAAEVQVRLSADGGWITLSVADNGRGAASDSGKDGIGILGMKERFILLGGSVESESNKNGFLITAHVPMRESGEPGSLS